jgi:hypothetical protein
MPAKTTKPATSRRPRTSRAAAKAKPRTPSQSEIAQRAYFIHLEEGTSDQLGNWLRAERELTAA